MKLSDKNSFFFHDNPLCGNQLRTLRRLSQLLYYPNINLMVSDYMSSRHVCHRNKDNNKYYPGLLEPFHIRNPNLPWNIIGFTKFKPWKKRGVPFSETRITSLLRWLSTSMKEKTKSPSTLWSLIRFEYVYVDAM